MIFNIKKFIATSVSLAVFASALTSFNLVFAKNHNNTDSQAATTVKNDISQENSHLIVFPYDNILEDISSVRLDVSKVFPQTKEKAKVKLTKIEKYKNELFHMGITDLTSSDEDALAIHKKAKQSSEIEGYLPDGAAMTVIEQTGKWYKIKSGDISGYVKTKYVIVDEDVEEYVMENNYVSALIKENASVLGNTKKDSTVVGMAYQNDEYPIIGFSDDEKYVFIQRTETISGWVPVSDIKITITAPLAMNEEELEEYRQQLEAEEQQAIDSYLSLQLGSSGSKLSDQIIYLIAHNESGNYMSARNPKTSGEKTITVGAWQWYGENAHNVLRLICSADTKKAKEIIDGAFTGKKAEEKSKQLYKDIMGHENWESSQRIFTNAELIAIKNLLGSNQGVSVQNSKIQSDIQSKIKVAVSTYKLTNDAITAYFCDLFWQSPNNARAIITECINHYKSAKKFCKAEDGLEYLHNTAMKNGVMKVYARRRNYTYSYCKNLDNNNLSAKDLKKDSGTDSKKDSKKNSKKDSKKNVKKDSNKNAENISENTTEQTTEIITEKASESVSETSPESSSENSSKADAEELSENVSE